MTCIPKGKEWMLQSLLVPRLGSWQSNFYYIVLVKAGCWYQPRRLKAKGEQTLFLKGGTAKLHADYGDGVGKIPMDLLQTAYHILCYRINEKKVYKVCEWGNKHTHHVIWSIKFQK